jgi:hypothetical protein
MIYCRNQTVYILYAKDKLSRLLFEFLEYSNIENSVWKERKENILSW